MLHYQNRQSFTPSIQVSGHDTPELILDPKHALLSQLKSQIDSIDSITWKRARWLINLYDFTVQDPIINRAYFKYIEMLSLFQLEVEHNVMHLAEAPGGFLQGTLQKRKATDAIRGRDTSPRNEFIVQGGKSIFTTSLKGRGLPTFNSRVCTPSVHICSGSGDVCDYQHILECRDQIMEKTGCDRVDFITADGGFDEKTSFNIKDQLHHELFYNEILAIDTLLKPKANAIIKMFDMFSDTSMHLVYLLSCMFDTIYIYKPLTSRPTNSERYIICKGFKPLGLKPLCFPKTPFHRIQVVDTLPLDFKTWMHQVNDTFGKLQFTTLKQTIQLANVLSKDTYSFEKHIASRKRVYDDWCSKFGNI